MESLGTSVSPPQMGLVTVPSQPGEVGRGAGSRVSGVEGA